MSSNLLLDTHALVEFIADEITDGAFSARLEKLRKQKKLYVSSVSFWEIALLVSKGRISIKNPVAWAEQVLAASGVQLLAPTVSEMIASAALPAHHKDPFDRLIIVQAKLGQHTVVTRDKLFSKYGVRTLWVPASKSSNS